MASLTKRLRNSVSSYFDKESKDGGGKGGGGGDKVQSAAVNGVAAEEAEEVLLVTVEHRYIDGSNFVMLLITTYTLNFPLAHPRYKTTSCY